MFLTHPSLTKVSKYTKEMFSFEYLETFVNDGWVKNTIIRLHIILKGIKFNLHILKVIQGLGGKFGKHFFKCPCHSPQSIEANKNDKSD